MLMMKMMMTGSVFYEPVIVTLNTFEFYRLDLCGACLIFTTSTWS